MRVQEWTQNHNLWDQQQLKPLAWEPMNLKKMNLRRHLRGPYQQCLEQLIKGKTQAISFPERQPQASGNDICIYLNL